MLPSNNLEQELKKTTHPTERTKCKQVEYYYLCTFFFLRESIESRTFFLKRDRFCLVEHRKFMEVQDHYKLKDY